MIKAIIFDLGGVIVRLNDISEPTRRFESIGFMDAGKYLGVYGQRGIFQELESGSIGAWEFVERLRELTGRPDLSYEEAEFAWMGYLKDVPHERLDNLLELKKRYRLFLLSNLNPFFGKWVKSTDFSGDGHPIGHYLEKDFYSYELKDYKPSASIFLKVLEATGLKAEECIFVDDGPANVASAEALGMKGLLVPKDADWMPTLSGMLESEQ